MGFCWGNLKGGNLVEDLDTHGSIMPHSVLKKQDVRAWTGVVPRSGMCHVLVNIVMDVRGPRNVGNFLTRGGTVSFSKRTLLHVVCY
jgi:hypothetical protein